jgi:ectoine hydroxylase-related dioxygenase (phytanoyl-CoA dioxygenase family)
MYYFKPPRARGQALHQDQYYLQVQPGTCVAAWMAVDRSDIENGCLQVVPGSHDLPVLCTEDASLEVSFTDVTVPLPTGISPEPVTMDPGDVLFFNGQIIHGSLPNTSDVRFRQSLVGHYIVGEASKVAKYYFPVLDMDGQEVNLDVSEGGGPCGVWVGPEGSSGIAMKLGTRL